MPDIVRQLDFVVFEDSFHLNYSVLFLYCSHDPAFSVLSWNHSSCGITYQNMVCMTQRQGCLSLVFMMCGHLVSVRLLWSVALISLLFSLGLLLRGCAEPETFQKEV